MNNGADRLRFVPVGTLETRLALARTALMHSQTAYGRRNAIREIDEINAELKRRGYQGR